MASWQLLLLGALVLVPFTLLADFHPDRERLDARGRPLGRDWSTGRVRRGRRTRPDRQTPQRTRAGSPPMG